MGAHLPRRRSASLRLPFLIMANLAIISVLLTVRFIDVDLKFSFELFPGPA